MRPVKMKLRSSRGASITYALLIFLVCAVVSSIVIVSASTAGGRMSGLKETDQRYYAAVGAARTLRDIFEGSDEVTVTYDPSGSTATADSTNAIVKAASEAVVTGTLNTTEPISITPPTGSTVTCSVQPKLENGLLKFDIAAVGGSNINTGTYKLTIAFTPNVKKPDLGNGKTATATVSWSLNSLSKGRATPTTTNPTATTNP